MGTIVGLAGEEQKKNNSYLSTAPRYRENMDEAPPPADAVAAGQTTGLPVHPATNLACPRPRDGRRAPATAGFYSLRAQTQASTNPSSKAMLPAQFTILHGKLVAIRTRTTAVFSTIVNRLSRFEDNPQTDRTCLMLVLFVEREAASLRTGTIRQFHRHWT